MLIPSDAAVKVLALRSNRLLVRQLREDSIIEQSSDLPPVAEHERTPLDDELSQS